jgi:hypothetical protein
MVQKTGDGLFSAFAPEMRYPEATLLKEAAKFLACLIGGLL